MLWFILYGWLTSFLKCIYLFLIVNAVSVFFCHFVISVYIYVFMCMANVEFVYHHLKKINEIINMFLACNFFICFSLVAPSRCTLHAHSDSLRNLAWVPTLVKIYYFYDATYIHILAINFLFL